MILFVLGTERFPFDRLVRAADLVQERLKEERVFVQLGETRLTPTQCSWTQFLNYEELNEQIREARVVVTHGGAGSLLLCIRARKIPIVLPRSKRFGEHVDDHQEELVTRMAELGYALAAKSPEEVVSLLLRHPEFQAAPQEISSSGPRLVESLSAYLNHGENLNRATAQKEQSLR